MRNIVLGISLILTLQVGAQSGSISFVPVWDGEAIVTGRDYQITDTNATVIFNKIRWYISDVTFLNKGKTVKQVEQRFFLMDLTDVGSMIISVNEIPQNFDEVRFNLGIDSATNASGVHGGDLDPTKGMYWTWQSGYINFKVEGNSTLCNNDREEFIYHLGGYSGKFNALQTVKLKTTSRQQIIIELDMKQFLTGKLLSGTAHIMKPGKQAVQTSEMVAKTFIVKE